MIYPVFPGVTLLSLPLVNVWLLAKGHDAALIDTSICYDRRRLLGALKEALPEGFRLQSVLLTHGHCDHAGNAAFLAEKLGARLYTHQEENVFLATRRTYVPRGWRGLGPRGAAFALGEVFFPVRRRAPDTLLADGDRVETPIGALTVIHTPGHTPGHAAYFHEKEGWLFSGDALINVIPFRRRTGLSLPPPLFNSDTPTAYRSARRMAELAPGALLAQHGWPLLERTAESIRRFVRALPI